MNCCRRSTRNRPFLNNALKIFCGLIPAINAFILYSFSAAPAVLRAEEAFGNEIFLLARGPLTETYGSLAGLMAAGSMNASENPMALSDENGRDLYLSHSVWYDALLSASTVSYTFAGNSSRPVGIMVSRIGLSSVQDSRGALLDYGADGLPGTLDAGENNGRLDPGERLDLDAVSLHSLENYALTVAAPFNWHNLNFGISSRLVYQDLLAAQGFGLNFNLFIQHKSQYLSTLVKISNLPVALTFFDNGATETYMPVADLALLSSITISKLTLRPGLAVTYYPGLNYEGTASLGNAGSLEFLPALNLQLKSLVSLGLSLHSVNGIKAEAGLYLQQFSLQYAWRGHRGGLGNTHLFALSFSLAELLAD